MVNSGDSLTPTVITLTLRTINRFVRAREKLVSAIIHDRWSFYPALGGQFLSGGGKGKYYGSTGGQRKLDPAFDLLAPQYRKGVSYSFDLVQGTAAN